MIKLNPRKPDFLHSRSDHTSDGLVVPLSRIADYHPKPAAFTVSPRWSSLDCCAISGYKVYATHGFAPELSWHNILDQSAFSNSRETRNIGETWINSKNDKIMMLSHIYDFWKAGLLAIHPETLRIRCFVPSNVISNYDDKAASFPDSDIPDRDSLRLHYEICVWVNMTACLPRIALEIPSATKKESMFHVIVRTSIEKAQALGAGNATHHEYCTQKCLLGLKHGGLFDEQCPNYAKHCGLWTVEDSSHLLDYELFIYLTQKQLETDQSLFCHQPTVSVKGHHAEFFKITLAGFGYTFCAKGVAVSDQHRLLNEYIMYQHMKDLQGMCVPVCLGLFALQQPFGSQNISGLEITHLLLMSNAGASVGENSSRVEACDMPSEEILGLESGRTMNDIRSAGVDRHDRRKKHLYWNAERKRVFYIDFEKNSLIAETDGNVAGSSTSELEGNGSRTQARGLLDAWQSAVGRS